MANRKESQRSEFRFASLMAATRGFQLNAARTEECALRLGRYWLTDRRDGSRATAADNLVEVVEFLSAVLPVNPDEHAAHLWQIAREQGGIHGRQCAV